MPSQMIRIGALTCLLVMLMSPLPSNRATTIAQVYPHSLGFDQTLGSFTHRLIDGRAACLEADIDEARRIRERQSPVKVISPNQPQSSPGPYGLRIVLRGTSQLENAPAALDGFRRAAARWEALILTGATIVVDVDYGPMLFDSHPFDDNVVAVTDVQLLQGNSLFQAVRERLTAGPYSNEKRTLYESLPPTSLPTDRGEFTGLAATSAALRALELIDSVADTEMELTDFGSPPAIGINSRIDFDFDPSDGIEPNKLDFEAIALHQLGHILGYVSSASQSESTPSPETQPSILDLFRFRPESANSFGTSPRILSSGGEHVFYAGGEMLPLSTAGPDGSGGDSRQASHWKDDQLSGRFLGVIDPTIGFGEHYPITDNDLRALDAIGYRTKSIADPTVVIPLVSGRSQPGNMFAPPANLGLISRVQYSIIVPTGATELRIALVGNQDVDLFVRFGQKVVLRGHNPVTDYMSTSETGTEIIVVNGSDSPPLREGIYYLAIVNFGPGDADFTITATVSGGSSHTSPTIFNIAAVLEGDSLGIDCVALDRNGDFATAEVTLRDDQGRELGSPSTFTVDSGGRDLLVSRHTLSGLNSAPTARRAGIVIVDVTGNRSGETSVDFGKAQLGALEITSASYSGSKLKIKVRGTTADLQLEINGRIVAPPRKIKLNQSGTKLTVKGSDGTLSLQPGANRIRMKNVNGWSNIVVLTL